MKWPFDWKFRKRRMEETVGWTKHGGGNLKLIASELKHLYEFMTEQGWEDRADAEFDEWVSEHLEIYACETRADVKERFNTVVLTLGRRDLLIP